MMIGRRLGIPERDLSETMGNLDDPLEMVVETSRVFRSRFKPWHPLPQWLFCLRGGAISACVSAGTNLFRFLEKLGCSLDLELSNAMLIGVGGFRYWLTSFRGPFGPLSGNLVFFCPGETAFFLGEVLKEK